ncbi:peptidoglycan recognition family protein [soil metagenome]
MYRITKLVFLISTTYLGLIITLAHATEVKCKDSFPIIQKPITFDAKRIDLTRIYRSEHYDIHSKTIEIIPQIIVLHWTNLPTLKQAINYFNPSVLQKNRMELSRASNLNVSTHFLVDRDGTIYQLMPTNWMARHVIGLNNIAIGIENVGGVKNKEDLTLQQVRANAYLVCMLKQRYSTIQYLIGHFEYLQFRNTPLWQEKDKSYYTIKRDPGSWFMTEVRNSVKKNSSKP